LQKKKKRCFDGVSREGRNSTKHVVFRHWLQQPHVWR
jgi:hypothetical protein